MTTPTFHGVRGVYRPLVIEDAAALHEAHSDPDVHYFWSGPAHTSLAQSEDYLARTLEMSPYHWALTKDGGECLGRLSLFMPRPGVGEFGVILRRAAHGQGLAGEALELVVHHAFGALDAYRLWADVDPENGASLRLFERHGFRREAVLRNNWRTHIGLRDSVILARFPG
jgi:[ribosomal protein S5]-alanine N-acetyltransferase